MFKDRHIPYRDLGLTILALLIAHWFYPQIWLLYLMAAFLVIGILIKAVRTLNHKMWVGITEVISKIFPPIFLTIIFFLVLVPFGFLFKLFTKSKPQSDTSNFETIDEKIDLTFFERVW